MKLNNRIFLMLGIASVFSLNNFSAMADKDCSKPPQAGYYCKNGDSNKNCEKGCYCTGSNKGSVGNINISSVCHYRDRPNNNEDFLKTKKIFFCPRNKPFSDFNAKSTTDCKEPKNECWYVNKGNFCHVGIDRVQKAQQVNMPVQRVVIALVV